MNLSLSEAKNSFSKVVQSLIDGDEETVIITKNGKPVVQIMPLLKKNSLRVGVAKKEMEGFDLSLEDLNNIPTPDFGL